MQSGKVPAPDSETSRREGVAAPSGWDRCFKIMRGAALVLGFVAGLLWAGVFVGISFGIHYSATDSVGPFSFFWDVGGAPQRGDLVIACLPLEVGRFGVQRGYLGSGKVGCPGGIEPVTKRLAAIAGDTVLIAPESVLSVDSAGRAMPHFPYGAYEVKPGEVWLMGSARKSWDSRYFGPVPASLIRTREEVLF